MARRWENERAKVLIAYQAEFRPHLPQTVSSLFLSHAADRFAVCGSALGCRSSVAPVQTSPSALLAGGMRCYEDLSNWC
jgi:hypothetical protein